jgi:hypothetical protein
MEPPAVLDYRTGEKETQTHKKKKPPLAVTQNGKGRLHHLKTVKWFVASVVVGTTFIFAVAPPTLHRKRH